MKVYNDYYTKSPTLAYGKSLGKDILMIKQEETRIIFKPKNEWTKDDYKMEATLTKVINAIMCVITLEEF